MIHGTNKPHTIGSRVSQGCIRLYSHDIEILFEEVKIGTPVTIIDQPIKVAEFGNRIFLETHFADSVSFETRKAQAKKLICEKIDNCKYKVRWRKVDDAIAKNLGIPMNISFPTFKQDYPTLLTPML